MDGPQCLWEMCITVGGDQVFITFHCNHSNSSLDSLKILSLQVSLRLVQDLVLTADQISIHLVSRQIKYSETNCFIKHANYERFEPRQINTLPLVSLVFPLDCHPASFYLPSPWQGGLLNTHLLTRTLSHNVALDIDLIYPGISRWLSQPTVGLCEYSMCHCCP